MPPYSNFLYIPPQPSAATKKQAIFVILVSRIPLKNQPFWKVEKSTPYLQYFMRTQVAEDDAAAPPYGQLWPKR